MVVSKLLDLVFLSFYMLVGKPDIALEGGGNNHLIAGLMKDSARDVGLVVG
jgi:hypothetical protein